MPFRKAGVTFALDQMDVLFEARDSSAGAELQSAQEAAVALVFGLSPEALRHIRGYWFGYVMGIDRLPEGDLRGEFFWTKFDERAARNPAELAQMWHRDQSRIRDR